MNLWETVSPLENLGNVRSFWYNGSGQLRRPSGALTPSAVTQEGESPMCVNDTLIACQRCKQPLPRSAYDPRINNGRRKGYYPTCRECRAKFHARSIIPNPDDPTGQSVLLPLTRGMYAVIDIADVPKVEHIKWAAQRQRGTDRWYARCHVPGSAFNGTKGHQIHLHRFLLNADAEAVVDHVNGNGLDNRRENLRIATPSNNQQNRKRQKSSTTGFKGVRKSSVRERWIAQIRANGKRLYLGSFLHREDAARAYDDAARRLYGEFACVNFPREGERQA